MSEKRLENDVGRSMICATRAPHTGDNARLSPNRGAIRAKLNLELTPLFVHIPLFVFFEVQVYMFSNGRDMTKCQCLHDDNDDAKAIALPWIFYENSRAENDR